MIVFSSWSGGKDCMLALHRVLQQNDYQLHALLNMCDRESQNSRSHGLKKELVQRQAAAMNVRLVQQDTSRGEYEKDFKQAVRQMQEAGVEAGVFGDIYLEEHRTWIERVCSDLGIQAIFPLWGESTEALAVELVTEGFKPLLVSVHTDHLSRQFLGRIYDQELIDELRTMEGMDVCAENGEFHTFVIDGPLFKQPVAYERGMDYLKDKHWFLDLN